MPKSFFFIYNTRQTSDLSTMQLLKSKTFIDRLKPSDGKHSNKNGLAWQLNKKKKKNLSIALDLHKYTSEGQISFSLGTQSNHFCLLHAHGPGKWVFTLSKSVSFSTVHSMICQSWLCHAQSTVSHLSETVKSLFCCKSKEQRLSLKGETPRSGGGRPPAGRQTSIHKSYPVEKKCAHLMRSLTRPRSSSAARRFTNTDVQYRHLYKQINGPGTLFLSCKSRPKGPLCLRIFNTLHLKKKKKKKKEIHIIYTH